MESISRVFYHELGHFVARELNYKHFKGAGTSQISIYPCSPSFPIYCGATTPLIPLDMDLNQQYPRHRLAQHLAAVMYGCIFQSYFLKKVNFHTCLDEHGEKDRDAWLSGLFHNNLYNIQQEFRHIENNYYEYLVSNQILDKFMGVNFENLLIETSKNNYIVNLEELRIKINTYVESHLMDYNLLLAEYDRIISQNN